MELVTINTLNHEVLKQPAKAVKFPLDAETKKFIENFLEFFASLQSPFSRPAGLAAPQVGVGLQIIVIQVTAEAKQLRKDVYDILPPTILINPTFTPITKNINKDWEACYSVPEKMGEVYRYDEISFEAYTIDGDKVTRNARGFLARLVQHEIGHLNGELYIDLLTTDSRFGDLADMLIIRQQEREQSSG